jgi:D-alanyl-D-alanine endopeptidase (penicillin-binding protein 7)
VIPTSTDASVSAAPTATATADAAMGYVVGESTPAFSKVADTAPPQLNDAAALIADLETGTPLLSLNASTRWPMASLTKLMTAAIVFDNLPMDQHVSITPQMFAVDPQEYTLQIGGTYTVSDLLRVLLLPSSNVAAEALADAYGRTQFLALMNEKAAQWGMTDTYYDDPSGLSAANESTAHDLLLLAQEISQNYPQIFAITRVPHVVITNLATGAKVPVASIDTFSGDSDFIGGKTGHTDEASGNLLTVFNYGGHPLFILVLGTDDRFGDSTKLYNWVKANYR